MNLNTHPENRKEMVKAISDLTELPAAYMGMPSAAFQIGPMTINRDGTIDCEDEAMIETVRPMLVEHGWLDAEVEPEAPAAPDAPEDLKEDPEEDSEEEIVQMDLTIPIEGWTVAKMNNLLRILYSKQYLINRMLNSDMLCIEESVMTEISESMPESPEDFEARIQNAVAAECIRGFNLADGKATLSTPVAGDDPERWKAYARLWAAILKTADTAARISIKRLDDPENEKYHANSWLMRMDFGGADYKETRRILMGHLTGFAAFKNAADMEAHKARQAQRRREHREEVSE